jgi:hypothetical protein
LLLLLEAAPALVVIAGVAVVAVVTPAALVGQLAGIGIFVGGWRRLGSRVPELP